MFWKWVGEEQFYVCFSTEKLGSKQKDLCFFLYNSIFSALPVFKQKKLLLKYILILFFLILHLTALQFVQNITEIFIDCSLSRKKESQFYH